MFSLSTLHDFFVENFYNKKATIGIKEKQRKGTEMNSTETEIDILKKLYNHNFIGEKHTSEDNVPKGFPKHLRGNVKKALKKLIREGYVTPKITSYGLEVSINPRRIEEIKKIIEPL